MQIDSPYSSKIRKTGSDCGIYISIAMLDFLNINPETDFIDVTIDDETIIIKKLI